MSNDAMSAEEIVLALRTCNKQKGHRCSECPVFSRYEYRICKATVDRQAADLIESQAAEMAKLRGKLSDEKVISQSLRNAANGYKAQLSASQQETRAAVEDLRGMCEFCKLYKECDPLHPLGRKYKTGSPCANWQWRGPQEESFVSRTIDGVETAVILKRGPQEAEKGATQ